MTLVDLSGHPTIGETRPLPTLVRAIVAVATINLLRQRRRGVTDEVNAVMLSVTCYFDFFFVYSISTLARVIRRQCGASTKSWCVPHPNSRI